MDLPAGKPILSLDFDGVCHSYTSGWKGAAVIPDPPVDGLFEFLEKAVEVFEVNIFSTRSHQEGGAAAMRDWFVKHCPDGKMGIYTKLVFPLTKPPAAVGLDDRIFLFEGKWPDIQTLKNFKPWNKRPSDKVVMARVAIAGVIQRFGDQAEAKELYEGVNAGRISPEVAISEAMDLCQRLTREMVPERAHVAGFPRGC
jgi:hypothetical protein